MRRRSREWKSSRVQNLRVTVTNLGPAQGHLLSPVWVGFHDGSFRLFDLGKEASIGVQRVAEDANTGPLTNEFLSRGSGIVQGTVFGSDDILDDIGPGSSSSRIFTLDRKDPRSRYLSYCSMVIPSNDAFMGNENPCAHEVFSRDGDPLELEITVLGSEVYDSGTEVNDETALNAAGGAPPPFFFRGAGVRENGVVHIHPGLTLGGPLLSNPAFANANFKAPGYEIARITVEEVEDDD